MRLSGFTKIPERQKRQNNDDAPRYYRIATALYKTIEIQKQIDKIYPEIEKNLVSF